MEKSKKRHRLTQADMVLIAMYGVAQGKTDKVPWEEVVIRAWREFPNDFSLRNHPEFPDGEAITKRVASNLRPTGLVVSLGSKFFRLTDRGVKQARMIIDSLSGSSMKANANLRELSREEMDFMKHALGSQAFLTWERKEKLIDYDAKLFFRFSTGTKLEARKLKVDFALETIQKSVQLGITNANQLQELADYLIHSFGELLEG